MRKKILFIISNMESGGVSKSMSNLLNVINTNKYEVDCLILSPQGIFLGSIPTTIRIISDERTALLCSKFPQNLKPLISKGYFWDAFTRLLAGCCMLFNKGWGGWILSRRISTLQKEYDLAVDYNGQHQLYYLVDKVKANKKITFFHSDYAKWDFYYSMDAKYMPKVDAIFTISELCVQSLKKYFPAQSDKIGLFENISSVQSIHAMAQEKVADGLDKDSLNLITIGHLSENKGTSLAIEAARILKERGIKFHWYFIGNSSQMDFYEKLAGQNGVQGYIIFMGMKSNPYPYLQQADIVVHPSLFEGKSIALDEAKIMCKPIVVTNFSTVNDQFFDGYNATICEMNERSLSQSIIELIENKNKRDYYIYNLKNDQKDNSDEIIKLYQIIEGLG